MNILFICTHNRCRSILGEAIANKLSDGRIRAFSAGSQPAGIVHPLTIAELDKRGISTDGLMSQSFDSFADANIDLSITVCDSAAGDPCPLWISDVPQIHWGLPDPTKIKGSDSKISEAFDLVINILSNRITKLLESDFETFETAELKRFLLSLAEDSA